MSHFQSKVHVVFEGRCIDRSSIPGSRYCLVSSTCNLFVGEYDPAPLGLVVVGIMYAPMAQPWTLLVELSIANSWQAASCAR